VIRKAWGVLANKLGSTLDGRQNLLLEEHGHFLSRRKFWSMELKTRKRGQFFLLAFLFHLFSMKPITGGGIQSLRSGKDLAIKI